MDHRHRGRSGLKISEIIYGNWLTHASQVEDDRARACVRAALDAGISTFDTADTYANTAAEVVLGEALKGERRESLEILTKVYFPTGPKGHNDTGLSRKHIRESIDGSLQRLQTDYVDLYQAHRYDYATPLEETMQAFADVVHSGKALYIGVSEWNADQPRAGPPLPPEPGAEPPEGSRARDEKGGADMIKRFLNDEVLTAVQGLLPIAEELGLTPAQLAVAWVLSNDNVAGAIIGASRPEQVTENVKAAG